MKAIYHSWECDESCGRSTIAAFSDDNDPKIQEILIDLTKRWPSADFYVNDYTPPRLNPRSIKELDIDEQGLDRYSKSLESTVDNTINVGYDGQIEVF